MFKKLFSSLSNKNKNTKESSGQFIYAALNEKIGPIDRGLVYEDPLDAWLKERQLGEVTGGGSYLEPTGEIATCDIEIYIPEREADQPVINDIISKLESLGAPKGSNLRIGDNGEPIPFGINEGLGIYLDGQNLPEEVYATSDINFVLEELQRLMNIIPNADRNWQGATETALYFYSPSFENMKAAILEFVNTYPLCKGARIVQIA